MIVETIVSTLDSDGKINLAPMGVTWGEGQLAIRPYKDTTTYRNLVATRQAVVNLTDNVLIFARMAVSNVQFATFPAAAVRGVVLADACSYREVVVESIDDRSERATVDVRVVKSGQLRDFLGFNRGKNAVIEAAVLATRVKWLGREPVLAEFKHLRDIVTKTGGEHEDAAMRFLEEYVRRWDQHGES